MTIPRVANKSCSSYVAGRQEFQGSHLYGQLLGGMYIVYSYGPHFPLYVYKDGTWYRNTDRRSVSTSRHYGQANPGVPCEDRNTGELRDMIDAYWSDREIQLRAQAAELRRAG